MRRDAATLGNRVFQRGTPCSVARSRRTLSTGIFRIQPLHGSCGNMSRTVIYACLFALLFGPFVDARGAVQQPVQKILLDL